MFLLYRVYIPCIYVLNKIDQISIEVLKVVVLINLNHSVFHKYSFLILVDLFFRSLIFCTKSLTLFQYLLIINGILMIYQKRYGLTYRQFACKYSISMQPLSIVMMFKTTLILFSVVFVFFCGIFLLYLILNSQ